MFEASKQVGHDFWTVRIRHVDIPELRLRIITDPCTKHVSWLGAINYFARARTPRQSLYLVCKKRILKAFTQLLPVFFDAHASSGLVQETGLSLPNLLNSFPGIAEIAVRYFATRDHITLDTNTARSLLNFTMQALFEPKKIIETDQA